MTTQIFVNLPVKDLPLATSFYVALGFTVNPKFTNEMAAAINISDAINVMLLTEPFFKTFTVKVIADATATTEVINALSVSSREAVDEKIQQGLAAGGSITVPPHDYGWMYYQTIADPDGHLWEIMYMDESAMPAQPAS